MNTITLCCTGYGLAYEMRPDYTQFSIEDHYELGCIDAPDALPQGATARRESTIGVCAATINFHRESLQ